MIELKQAIERAKKFIIEMNGEQEDLQLEYVKHFESNNIWRVTYSFWRGESPPPNQLQAALGITRSGRVYRTIDIKDDNGEVVSMQMGSVHEVESV